MSGTRRRWLMQAGALTGSVALPLWVPAATESPSTLSALPRAALVMGNTDYTEAPLRNPANDAKAISIELQKFGFKVNLQLNAGRAQMAGAIKTFGSDLANSKGVGLFYYAGHAAQLAWRNYLIPVDAAIDKLEDMRDKTIELNTLLQGLIGARNPMNMIILDACRDNPFGNKVLIEQRGLSQFDAPPGSLLAYATSPGNTAADGEGDNGLYTENLLRELTVPEAKIEDVFKRVRLAVRRTSAGRQIPWESTSLEEDFYFQPPKQVKKPSKEELDRQFEEELAIWETIKNAKEPAPLEDYLRRYPSGKFSEVAQFRLERVLAQIEQRAQLASASAAQAAADRKRREQLARAEAELKKQQELAQAEASRKQKEEIARAEMERKRQEALSKAEAERARLEELARAEAERRKKEDLAKAESERKQQEELARAEAELKKQQELAKVEAAKFTPGAAIVIASIAPNPFSKGTAVADTNYKVGDSYTFRTIDLFTKIEKLGRTRTITQITDTEVIFDTGHITDLLGNVLRNGEGRRSTGSQIWGLSYSIGKRWTSRHKSTSQNGIPTEVEFDVRVVARENIAVPAGTFDAFVLETHGWARGHEGGSLVNTEIADKIWIAPGQVRALIARETLRRWGGKTQSWERQELVAYRQS